MNAILGSLKVTDLVLTLTNGKPSGKTEVMMTYIYKKFFGDGGASGLDFGYGAARTVVLVLKEAETVYSSGMTVKMTIKIKNRYRKNFALALIRIVIACSLLSQ